MAKTYGVNTVDGYKYYGCQIASLRAQQYGCFTCTTIPYKPYYTVMVRSTEYFTLPHIFCPDLGRMVGMVGIW